MSLRSDVHAQPRRRARERGTIEGSVASLRAENRELAGRLSTEDLAALMRTTSAEAAEDDGG